jgi:cyclopropane-fatty-acyl-phospholipid synthase
MDPRAIVSATFDRPRDFDVELWDGRAIPRRGRQAVRGRVVLRTPAAVTELVPPVDERRVAEAFVAGHLDIAGDVVAVLEAMARWKGPHLHPLAVPWAVWVKARERLSQVTRAGLALRRRHSLAGDARSVQHHYDLSNDFYRLFLDEALVYSCAYFARGNETIDEAQRAKLELVCRKLNLQPGEQLLDVGCGWGGLLLYAAERFQVKAIGTTISRNQFLEARRRASLSPDADRVRVLDCDYRRLPDEPVDKIVSIGMMEHVGANRLDDYFAGLYSRLRPGGLLLNQAIAEVMPGKRTVPWLRRPSGGFIEREIFPDSEMPSLGTVLAAAERQGFEVRDIESLREHYAQTLQHWLARFERRFSEAVILVGERKARAWRLYLAASAVAFRLSQVGVYQTLLAKRTDLGEARGLPRSRAAWSEEPLAASSPALVTEKQSAKV